MSPIRYVDYETVVAINAEHCGDGAGVRDEAGIRAQLGRAEASFGGGVELYPSVIEKAAVILHGISSTQGFHDGNKRTAWLVAKLFLALNGVHLRDVPIVNAEAIVMAVATKAFENEDEPERGVEKASDWFSENKLTAIDRYHFAFVALRTNITDSRFDAIAAMIAFLLVPSMPVYVEVSLLMHVKWLPIDSGEHPVFRILIEDTTVMQTAFPTAKPASGQIPMGYAAEHWFRGTAQATPSAHHNQVSPQLINLPIGLQLLRPGLTWLRIELNGELFARLPLEAQLASDIELPDDFTP